MVLGLQYSCLYKLSTNTVQLSYKLTITIELLYPPEEYDPLYKIPGAELN